jgi:hypothetical protein
LLKAIPETWVCKIAQTSKRGTPDILMCMSGVFVAIELKTDTGKTSKLQDYNLDRVAKSRGIAIVMTPKNMHEMLDRLKAIAQVFSLNCKENEIWR